MGIRTLDESNRVVFTAVEVLEDGPDGLWVTGLPNRVNLITVGQEYVTVGEKVEPVYTETPSQQIAAL